MFYQTIAFFGCKNFTPTFRLFLVKNQYLGVWYEIARTENIWEIGLKCVTANYTLKNDGTIRVENKGVSQKQ